MYGSGLIKGLVATGKHFFQREYTEQWPEQRPDLPPASHGFFEYDFSKCIGCGMCERACPNHVIKVTTEKNEAGKKVVTNYQMDIQYCLFCGFCVEACPVGALKNANNFEIACYHRDGTTYDFNENENVAHEMNEAFNELQSNYWDKKRPGGNPVGRPEPVKPPKPARPAAKPVAKPAAPGAAKPAAPAAAAEKPAAPAPAAKPAEAAAPAAKPAEAPAPADKPVEAPAAAPADKEEKGATE